MDIQVKWKEITMTFIDDYRCKKSTSVSMIYTNICQRCEPSPSGRTLTSCGHMLKKSKNILHGNHTNQQK